MLIGKLRFTIMKEGISVMKEVLKAAIYLNIQVAELGAVPVLISCYIFASKSEFNTVKVKI